MPTTPEVSCESAGCELEMFELHYTYDMPEDVTPSDFQCSYCGQTESLSESFRTEQRCCWGEKLLDGSATQVDS